MKFCFTSALGAVLAIVLVCQPLLARPWTDSTGRKIEAKFVRVHQGKVVLLQGKKVVQVPFYNLSEADQQFVRDELDKAGKSHLIPAQASQASDGQTASAYSSGPTYSTAPAPQPRGGAGYPGSGFVPPAANMPPQAAANFARMEATHAKMMAEAERMRADQQSRLEDSRRQHQELSRASVAPTWPNTHTASAPTAAHGSQAIARPYEQMARHSPDQAHSAAPPIETLASASPDYSYSAPKMQKQCESCNGIVSDNAKVGDRCPHCGVKWDYDDTTGESSSNRSWRSRRGVIKGGIFVIVVVCGLLAKLFKGSD